MLDFKTTAGGDLYIGPEGDIEQTDSVIQAVKIRLRWFYSEWRLGPSMGFPYFDEVFVKTPNIQKIKFLIRDLVSEVNGVTGVGEVSVTVNSQTRTGTIKTAFTVGEETYTEEVQING